MKKYIAWLLVMALAVSIAACANDNTDNARADKDSKEISYSESEESSTAPEDSSKFISSEDEESTDESVSSEEERSEEETTSEDQNSSVPEASTDSEDDSSEEQEHNSSEETSANDSSLPPEESSTDSSSIPDSGNDTQKWTNSMIGQQSTDYHGFSPEELDAYFDGAIITGDSVTNGLKIYTQNYEDIFGNVVFHTGASYGYNNALSAVTDSSQHPLYRGQRRTIWEMVQLTGAKKVFIGFGLNDFGYSTTQRIVKCLDTITSKIYAVDPDVEIVILSSGYFTKNGEVSRPQINDNRTNVRQREYNQLVLEYCNANSLDYIDVSNCFSDEYGYLRNDITLDDYCHPRIEEYTVWRDILYSYAAQKMLAIYTNPETMS